MQQLTPAEAALVASVDAAPMLDQVLAWSAINTGTGNLAGLAEYLGLLTNEFAALPGEIALVDPAKVGAIAADGREIGVAYGRHMVLRVRPTANRRFLLTGHMDTVFPADHAFQTTRWLDNETLNGPGVADMKGGIAVILAALKAFESSAAASGVGYDVLLNSDEETGSLSSAPLIAELAAGKIAALTYEPAALPDGTLAGARGGSGNYSLIVTGKSAHAGRNPQDGRNAILAAAALALPLHHPCQDRWRERQQRRARPCDPALQCPASAPGSCRGVHRESARVGAESRRVARGRNPPPRRGLTPAQAAHPRGRGTVRTGPRVRRIAWSINPLAGLGRGL